jgi:hypothetical protein
MGLAFFASLAAIAPGSAKPTPAVCHETEGFVVITRARDNDPGSDILVRAKPPTAPKAACLYAPKPKDYTPGKGETADFLALHGRFLALDAGTGPDRRLLILDLAARKKLIDAAYVDGDIVASNPDGFTFWRIGDAVAPPACPADWRKDNADATAAHATSEVFLSFATGTLKPTGKTGCTRTQGDL